ncbi:MAG: hypothetical protein EOP45_20725, partial [Sphingobacteriaceae bacterium]
MITVSQFESYVEGRGYHMFSSKDPRSFDEGEVGRIQTHMLCSKTTQLLSVPKEDISALYSQYLQIKDPKPCLVERTKDLDFPLFFDVDFKLATFCKAQPQTEEEIENKVEKIFDLNYTFGEGGAKQFFLDAKKVLLRVIEQVVKEVTSLPTVQLYISVRTCYKFHIHVPDLIVNEHIAQRLCSEIIDRWQLDPEYQACPQNPKEIVDPSVYKTGLRMLGGEKGRLTNAVSDRKDRKLHELIFGDLDDYKLIYPTVVGYPNLTLEVLKKFSVRLIDEAKEVNVTIPRNWKSSSSPVQRIVSENRAHTTPTTTNNNALVNEEEEMILNAVRPYV